MSSIVNDIQQAAKYKPLLSELVKRDLKIKYRRSFLGYVWSMLNPLLMMCVMSYVFTAIFQSSIENFPLYLICGQTLWNCFNESTTTAMYSVLQNGALMKKVYIPKYIFPVSRVLSSFVTMSFSLIAVLIVILFTRAAIYPTILLFWIPVVLLLVFSCGVGLLLSALSVYFRDITHLYSVLTLAWMYATPVFYSIEILPPEVQSTILLNPMYYYLTFFRSLILDGVIPPVSMWVICIISSLISVALGMFCFKKMENKFILYI